MNDLFSQQSEALPAAPSPIDGAAHEVLALLHGWADKGWLRRLDSAMAAFMLELDAAASPVLLVGTAVLVQMEGRGHTCLPLRQLVTSPGTVLAWPAAARSELMALWASLPDDLPDWLKALQASKLVRHADDSLDRGQPLVLSTTAGEPLLYLRRYWLYEQQVAQAIRQRCAAALPVDEALAARWLARLFDAKAEAAPASAEFDWQRFACAVALRASLTVITGGPGTGKTYTAARLLALLLAMSDAPQGLRVALAAPTGKAAARLRQSIDSSLQELHARLGGALDLGALTQRMGAARTLHSLLGASVDTRALRYNASNQLDIDILIVDEASMIHLEMMSALLAALPASARLILLGDKDQLASVEAGAVLGDLCHDAVAGHYNAATLRYARATVCADIPVAQQTQGTDGDSLAQQTVMLRRSRRFGGQIGQLAFAVNGGQFEAAQALLAGEHNGVLHASQPPGTDAVLALAVQGRAGAPACYADYLRCMAQHPDSAMTESGGHEAWVKQVLLAFERFRILCAVREGDWGTVSLNAAIGRALERAGLLKPRGEWFAGRPVMVTRNDAALGVFNGDVGVALPAGPGAAALRVYFLDGDTLRSVAVSRLAHVETAFAMTVHKSQGSEFMHTALVLPPGGGKVLTRELVYTGITRARDFFTLLQAQGDALQLALATRSQRASGLQALLGSTAQAAPG